VDSSAVAANPKLTIGRGRKKRPADQTAAKVPCKRTKMSEVKVEIEERGREEEQEEEEEEEEEEI